MANETVLIADNDRNIVDALSTALEQSGYAVITASDGAEAVSLAVNHRPDLILLDVMMPALSGHEVIQEIRKNGVQSPVIIMTGNASYESAVSLTRAGACDYVHKPIGAQEIINRIKRALVLESTRARLEATEKELASLRSKYDKRIRSKELKAKKLLKHDRSEKHAKPFIVHGRDHHTKLELKNYLQNILHLGQPIILHEQPSMGRTIIEKFEAEARGAKLVFVLLTPDDLMASGTEDNKEKRRAIFEMGYFFAKLQRTAGRVLLLTKGKLDLPSDISGVVYLDISDGIEAAGESIRKELRDWLPKQPRPHRARKQK